jgi:hypothetical protein
MLFRALYLQCMSCLFHHSIRSPIFFNYGCDFPLTIKMAILCKYKHKNFKSNYTEIECIILT